MIIIFVYFAYVPISSFIVDEGTLEDVTYDFNASADQTDNDNIDVFDVFTGLFTFSITGVSVPFWMSIFAVYVPLLWLALGVYAIIRGI